MGVNMSEEVDYETIIQENLDECNKENLHLFFGKKTRRNNKTVYVFYEADTNDIVRSSLVNFFINNLRKLRNDNITTGNNENVPEEYLKTNLEGIHVWDQFECCVYSDISKFKDVDNNEIRRANRRVHQVKKLKNIKSNLNHYLLINESDNCIFGQISRIKSSKVLLGKKRIFFEGEKFTEMKTEENIELEETDSVLFYIDKDHKWCFVNNIEEYDEIFDMHEQYETNAINLINASEFSNHCNNMGLVNEIIRNDRNIQKMLNKELTVESFENFDLDDIKDSFKTFNRYDVVDEYDVVFENEEFIIDENNGKESLKNIIKFVGGYYNQSLNRKFLIEGNPSHIINNVN